MKLLGKTILGVWGFLWAAVWTAIIGTIFLVGALFLRGPWWTNIIMRWFAWMLLIGVGIRIRVQGREHIPSSQACVIMANHRSYLDIPAVVLGLKEISVVFVAKRELTRIPFFGWALAFSYHIKVDRGDREQAIAALRESMKKMGDGMGLAVFPEGTRSRTKRLLPFKKGGFYVAVDTGFSILPISIRNSDRLLGKNSFLPWTGTIHVQVHPPLSTKGKRREDIPALMTTVRETILSGLPEASRQEHLEVTGRTGGPE